MGLHTSRPKQKPTHYCTLDWLSFPCLTSLLSYLVGITFQINYLQMNPGLKPSWGTQFKTSYDHVDESHMLRVKRHLKVA